MRKARFSIAAAVGALSLALVPILARADSAPPVHSQYPACCVQTGTGRYAVATKSSEAAAPSGGTAAWASDPNTDPSWAGVDPGIWQAR